MKSYMCKLRVGSFITQYSLLPLCNVCGNKKVLFGNLNQGNRSVKPLYVERRVLHRCDFQLFFAGDKRSPQS